MIRARTVVAVALASATCALAQFPGGGDGGPQGGGPPGGGRGGDMQRGPGGMMGMGDGVEQAKAALKATDEEWQVLRPAIQKVVAARRAADNGLVSGQIRGGMFGGRGGGRGGPGGGMGNDSFNGPNNSGPGGRGGWGNRGGQDGGPPRGDNPDGPPPPANDGNPPNSTQPAAVTPNGGPTQQNGGNRQPNGGPNGGPNAGGPPGMMAPTGPVGAAMTELKTAAAKDGVKAAELNAKIAAVRAERKKARDGLASAVDELKALVTPEQEAMLIALGYLE